MTDLLSAYRRTSYVVLDDVGGAVAAARIGETSTDVDAVLGEHGASSGVFITAWNPRSVPTSDATNATAHERLAADLAAAGVATLPQMGVGDDPSWAPEHGLLALDLAEDDAIRIGATYGQNAVVIVEAGRPARLARTPTR